MLGAVVSHYRIVDKLGAGGMGVVYRAEDLRLGRHVALKFLPENAGTDPTAVERFAREARTASSLNHPHICTIHDVGEELGRRFIVMELVDGVTLDRLIASGPLGLERLIDIGIQVADALDAAHAEGILHRDIKPGNIFITKRQLVKVVDFGLAKVLPLRPGGDGPREAAPHFTTSVGIAVGTVAYMSPEHARGEPLDARSDVFSLGVVLYEMATGVQTFRGQTTAVIFDQILNRVPAAPSSVNPDIPPQLEQIVARAIEKDRRHRYQSARDLQSDLEHLRRDMTAALAIQAAAAAASAGTRIPIGPAWATRPPDAESDTLLVPGSPFAVPDAPPAPPSAPRAPTSRRTGPHGADAGRERQRTPVAATPARAPVAPVVLGAKAAVDPNAATIISPPKVRVLDADATRVDAPAIPGTAHPAAKRRAGAMPEPRRLAGHAPVPVIAAGLLGILAVAGAGFWLLQHPELPASASATIAGPVERPAAPIATSEPVPSAATAPPPATASPATPVAGAPALPARGTTRPATGTPAPQAAGARPAYRPTEPAAASKSAAAREAEAEAALASARDTVARGDDDASLAALSRVSVGSAGTPAATEALAMIAELQLGRGQLDSAIDAWVSYAVHGGEAERAGNGLLRTADASALAKTRAGDAVARRGLDELLARFPAGGRAVRALQMKTALEDRMKLTERDDQLQAVVPASLVTLRTVAAQAGSAPVAELALWRLGQEYRDRKRLLLAAQTLEELATRFPGTRYEAWFSAAEIYDRQLRNPARARDAYLKVPPSSARYAEAQRRARRVAS